MLTIGLHGYVESGKNWIASQLHDKYGFHVLSYAEPVRKALLILNPIVSVPRDWVPPHEVSWVGCSSNGTYYYARIADIVPENTDACWRVAKRGVPEIRFLLQKMGTEAGRDIHGQTCWVRLMRKNLAHLYARDRRECLNPDAPEVKVVITDVRFPNEEHLIREHNCFTIPPYLTHHNPSINNRSRNCIFRVEREGCRPVNSHVSETNPITCDSTLTNNPADPDNWSKIEAILRGAAVI